MKDIWAYAVYGPCQDTKDHQRKELRISYKVQPPSVIPLDEGRYVPGEFLG